MDYTGKNDRRKATRIPFNTAVCLRNPLHAWNFESLDISLKGILLSVPGDWLAKIGEQFQIEVSLSRFQPYIFIRIGVTLIHREDTKAGFSWGRLDSTQFTHLYQLIESYLGDSELMQREVTALGVASDPSIQTT